MKTTTIGTFCASGLAIVMLAACGCAPRPTGPGAIDADAPTEFTTTESGLQYRILRKGEGPKPRPSDRVRVDYTGWLDDGTVFDSSYEKKEPASFMLSGVVDGWTEGMQFVSEGGMIELIVPYQLGYGEAGQAPRIPPRATLHFKVELHAIE